jgi:hypothetical protein
LRVDNPNASIDEQQFGERLLKPAIAKAVHVPDAGSWRFDKSITLIGMRGAPGDKGGINPSKVTQICVLTDSAKTPQSFEISSITAGEQFKMLNADKFIPFIDQFG